MPKHTTKPCPAPWTSDTWPDPEVTVLLRVQDDEFPIFPGWFDGEFWRYVDAEIVALPVLGWMDIHVAARLLDTRK